ncbi:DMT family transporter [Phanerochaete sordida]|uniref:DMT family transporter n=1 Tax=Phanerochaete sordida TaxID=48140 RepID=A0A9P3G2X0_9APHY|nr:DMT family transporter [Phanerochaete sordida]
MPSSLYVPILIAGMLITGSSNSLWSKWQDMQCVENCDDPNPRNHVLYEQPVWQTLQMFLGEMLCFLPVIITLINNRRKRTPPPVHLPTEADAQQDLLSAPPLASVDGAVEDESFALKDEETRPMRGWAYLLLWLPAACDLTGTTLMNVGLLYTPVSIYQMTRGALVLFVGVLSVLFLSRRLWLYQWLSLVTVMAGVSLVGFSGSMVKDAVKDSSIQMFSALVGSAMNGSDPSAPVPPPGPIEEPEVTKVLLGVFFILFAQVFTATQFVVEEKIMSRYSVAPLVAVGYEGLFGALSIVILMPLLPVLRPSLPPSAQPFFDLTRGLHQMLDTPTVLWSGVAIAISISLFNFFGLSVTRHVSATARSLTDTCRTLSIWIISLGLGWEKLVWPVSLLQVIGFTFLVYGTFLFNNLVQPPKFLRPDVAEDDVDERRALLSHEALDETAILPADLGQSGYDVVPPHGTHPHGPQGQRQRSRSRSRND